MEFEFFFQIALILLSTKLAGDLSVRLGQPSVLGKLIVGIVIGPAVLGWIENSELLTQLSNVGVILLMFMAGLETDLEELNANRNSSLAVALGGIILPFVGGYVSGLVMGMEQGNAVFLGLLLCATSVSISVQTLRDLGKMKTRESTTMLGAAVFDDILVVILLAFAMSFLGTDDVNLTMVILKKVVFFASIILIGWKGVPAIMRWLSPLRVSESIVSAALIICFSFAYFGELLGIAGIIGAFAAGIAISQTNYKHEVEKKVEPIAYAMFVPVFFVSIGMNITFDGIGNQIWFILALTVIAVLTKLIGCGFGARMTGFDAKSSAIIGAGMVSRGEVALIIAGTGLSSGLLAKDYFTAIVIVVILTTMITPPMLKYTFGAKDKAMKASK
ncbi:monovalent cation:proton antiporter-2 (CPA2) family transporter [Bacillus cereus BAG1X2-3]|uniref:Na+/H+/K+ antiporter GerN n=2 Tax=Bacillus cereus group TaxID=86661 RepID=A0A9X7E2D2_BACCE|nr:MULTISPECIES: cation:proton antiporter [Bacillus cereus group]AKR08751.1 sodium:proton antiporter [Bacillus thuringiensis]EOO26612.1 monovalent cation:proton antiporter-2 (CPA2) family transporter [Bacillus cereus BAG1X1-1]EOO50557.1 monovalent cation:proton antiporter-2 (CPA2) family transporter [Bacillus cereus BAG1X2-2]EOO50780.1 monovalent cation:proton antiporter-2 (CPA2) family transporter [Bacillus cereus BAG1X2-1]EOO60979.1 monovalent cation:proton antiporter-2 (CPA2) family transpo